MVVTLLLIFDHYLGHIFYEAKQKSSCEKTIT